MDTIYQLMEAVLPFSFMKYTFMKNAFLAILLITPLFGMLGTMIVNNKLAFFSDALGHSAFTGLAIGVLFHIADTNLTMAAFAIVFALLLNAIKRRNSISTDTIISVFSSLSTAIGLVILSGGGQFSRYSALLVGDILSITAGELFLLLLVLIGTLIFWGVCFNRLQAASINASLAKSKGVPVAAMESIFAVITALIVIFSIKWVGILIINALLILPAAAARNLAGNMREYHLFSVMISLFSGLLGLVLSYFLNTATGPTIVIIAAGLFFLTLLARPLVKN